MSLRALDLSLTASPVQLDAFDRVVASAQAAATEPRPALTVVQGRSRSALDGRAARTAAASGVGDAGRALPFVERIQRSFGRHSVADVRAHTGPAAARANDALGAMAFASGEHVAFRGEPDLFTAAHEAAHVVQQRGGVSLRDGVGAPGDLYERHADEVASLVVQGRPAESLLDRHAGTSSAAVGPVQRDEARAPSHAPSPDYDGDEMGPREADAVFLDDVAKALVAEAERRDDLGAAERSPSVQKAVARVIREEVAKVREAMGGGGDWRRYLVETPWSSRDVRYCVKSVAADAFSKAFDLCGKELVHRIKLNCMKLEPLHATLVVLRESVKQVKDVFEDVADYLELIGYVEQLKSIGDWVGLGVTRGASTPNMGSEASLFLSGSSGGSGAALARALASSKLVTKIGERNAALACFANDGDPDECMRLARGLDGTLREIAKISDAIEADYRKLADMGERGVCAITKDPLVGCQR